MAARVIAQLIVNGTAILSKAFLSAYQQALRNAKAGGAPGAASAAGGGASKLKFKMQPSEALQILNIERGDMTRKLLNERYKTMFESNDPSTGGSFYIQSKIFRSKEVLDHELDMKLAEKEEKVASNPEGRKKGGKSPKS
mmetsp:Transcript_1052/g.1741  ORF Transcript_1052/g.1741 Transcript_1052/m.1741 type:complete len:140 (+) Transcript_1052:125-544(+)|eukprot:CAMPEP_0174977822 /NCGR_PEP_ID=MMETSP0004_2-20121128/13822_1 /TAXON_ID=420556 /ORGANISM="Ochromonas sp., Strain CCMP1393" /LENGTH=139 /DNA_ID=CAMNT_0016229047 /DNA_START=125 /DNA_END=544 /DNA_ORIENTATION=+